MEVKTTLKVRHVAHFVDAEGILNQQAPTVYRGKSVYGAVAYLKADESADRCAEGRVLFVIRATGSSASITGGGAFAGLRAES